MNKFKFSTVTSVEWKDFFLEFFDKEVHVCVHKSDLGFNANHNNISKAREGVFDKVEWDKWFYEPGMPPFTPT